MSGSTEAEQKAFMAEAVRLSAEQMRLRHGGPFGAVVVKDGRVVAEGWNCVTSTNDPTAHAEVTAIRKACGALGTFSLEGCELYTSCEPCPMCLSAIYWARIDRVYYANTRHHAAEIGFDDALIYAEVSKPIDDRTIPMVRIDLPEAEAVFAEWARMPDKILY